ncbi:Histone-lysine N-methyltransferase SMYD3 [Trichinella sp. T6]|nr:Histone-lysine N-methyltransferase SMYD3 [Trichinella sp. T6]
MCNVHLMPEVAEEWPWAYVISQNIDSSHYCCSKYCGAVYCDENCHNQAISDHRYECKVLLHNKGDFPSDTIRLMVRIIGKLNDNSSTSNFSCKASHENREYDNLMSHKEEIFKEEKRTSEFSRCCYFLKYVIEPNKLPETSILMEMFGKFCSRQILINGFVILDHELNSAGLGLYLNLSQLNHSCNPSCVVTFDGPKAYLNTLNSEFEITTSTVLKNLTISYVALIDDTAHRRKALHERYYFICKCERCSDARLDSIATALVCDNGNCDGMAIIDVAEDYYKRTEELLAKQQKWLHPLNVHRIRTLAFVGHAAYESGRTERTLLVYEELISKYEFYLEQFHPLIAVNFMTVGKLYMLRNMYTTALSFLEKSLNVMKYSHGEKHSLYVHLLSMIEKCQLLINVHDNILQLLFLLICDENIFYSKSKMNMHVTFIALFIFSIVVAFDVAYASTQQTAKGASNREAVNVKPRANAKRAAATSRHSPESHAERRG